MTRSAPLKIKKALAEKIQKHRHELEEWFEKEARRAPPPFYCSIDLRDSGHKIVPVDSNLYPAGFNNICPEDIRTAPQVLREYVDKSVRKILIIPEAHTSNQYYIENLYYLSKIFADAGYDTRLGWYSSVPEETGSPLTLTSVTHKTLTAHPIHIDEKGVISAGGFVPDLVLLNNDFSAGYPKPLDLVKQPIVPSHALGWHTRKKSEHFKHYNALAGEFARIAGIDPWVLQIETEEVAPVNFDEEEGVEQVAQVSEKMLGRIQKAYEAHGINRKPFVFVKNNAGTYGMGIMVVHSPEELRAMNRRTKHKMSVGKNRSPIHSVVVQEGVPTATTVDSIASEPVIYLVGCQLIGGFMRANTERGEEENLNAQGMVFKKLCMSDLREYQDDDEPSELPVLETVYGAVARLSALATGRELLALSRTGESHNT